MLTSERVEWNGSGAARGARAGCARRGRGNWRSTRRRKAQRPAVNEDVRELVAGREPEQGDAGDDQQGLDHAGELIGPSAGAERPGKGDEEDIGRHSNVFPSRLTVT